MSDLFIRKAICDDEHCTGCLACVNTCSHNAITKGENEEGFIRPVPKEDLCVNCGKCLNVCPVLHPLNVANHKFAQTAYACWSQSSVIRKESSSGGLFPELAEAVLSQGGIVYGAKLDENIRCVLSSSDVEGGIDKFKGSKYVQCDIGANRLTEIKKLLAKGTLVLFSGTPCQVAGLKNFLRKDYENLITVDFLCHGVPSPQLFQAYIKYLETVNHAPITGFKFRDKQTSWRTFNFKIMFNNGKTACISRLKDSFYQIFLRDYALQMSCYNCRYTKPNRDSDITMADYWMDCRGAEGKRVSDDDKGMSLCLINTAKGKELFEIIKDRLVYYPLEVKLVRERYKYLHSPTPIPSNRKDFWLDFNKSGFDLVAEKYGYPSKMSLADKIVIKFGQNKWNELLIRILRKIQYILNK